jgi:hypothetical protein
MLIGINFAKGYQIKRKGVGEEIFVSFSQFLVIVADMMD